MCCPTQRIAGRPDLIGDMAAEPGSSGCVRSHRFGSPSGTFASGVSIDGGVPLGVDPVVVRASPGGDVSGEFCRISPSRPQGKATPRTSAATGPPGSRSLPAATGAVSPGMGPAPGPHVPATGPRRAQNGQALLHRRDGLALRPAHPRGSHLLGLGQGHRLDPQHPGPPSAAGPDRAGIVHTGPALPDRGREPGRSGRVPAQTPAQVAPARIDPGLGDLRSDAVARDFVSTRPFVSLRPARLQPLAQGGDGHD